MIERYKHIIWDWNGTLLDDLELCVDIINGILTARDLQPLTLEKYKELFTFPVKDYYAAAGIDFRIYSFDELGMEWITEYDRRRGEAKLHDGASEILNFINSKNIGQSILSAYSQNSLEEIINNFGLQNYFAHVIGLDHIYATSKIELGKNLMNKLNHEKGKVLLIGDTIHDYEVACEIGADCILIANGHQNRRRLMECGVPVLENLEEIFPI